jgi:hypothetical protein
MLPIVPSFSIPQLSFCKRSEISNESRKHKANCAAISDEQGSFPKKSFA